MIAGLKNYLAVLCKRCNDPIPVPRKIVSLQREIESGDPNTPRAFPLRCRLCEQEHIYEFWDIQQLDGEPPTRPRFRARKAGAR